MSISENPLQGIHRCQTDSSNHRLSNGIKSEKKLAKHVKKQTLTKKEQPDTKELLPDVKRSNSLPDKGSDADFDQSFLHQKKPLLDLSRTLLNYEEGEETTDFEKKLLDSPSGRLLKFAKTAMNIRMKEQADFLESFKHFNKKTRYTRAQKLKILEAFAEDLKINNSWLSGRTLACWTPYLGTLANLGIQLFAHYHNGNIPTSLSVAQVGTRMIATLAKVWLDHETAKIDAKQHKIDSETTKIQFHHEKNKTKLSKALNGMKLSEYMNELKAASNQIGEEDKLKERIAKTLSSAG